MSNYYHIKKHCRKGTAVQPDMHLTNANNDSDWLQRRVNRRFQLHHKLRCKLQHVPTSGYIVRLSVLCMFVCFLFICISFYSAFILFPVQTHFSIITCLIYLSSPSGCVLLFYAQLRASTPYPKSFILQKPNT